jgi:hypothetical protein
VFGECLNHKTMSEETAKELIRAINELNKRLDADKSDWITNEEALLLMGKRFTKGTARKHMQKLRLIGTVREYKKDGRDYLYSKSEILKLK